MIYTFIFSERGQCANKTIERKAPKQCIFSSDDEHNFLEKKGLKQKFHSTKKIPLCRVTLGNDKGMSSICLYAHCLVSINYSLSNFLPCL